MLPSANFLSILHFFLRTKAPRMREFANFRANERTCACLKYVQDLVTIAMGGVNIDVCILVNLKRFIEENCIMGLSLVERVEH